MAQDITNEKLPADNTNAPDAGFQNDTSNNNQNPPELNYQELSEGGKQLKAIDDEIKAKLYPDPTLDEFVLGRNIDMGMVGVSSSGLGIIVGHVTLPLAPTISEMTQNVSGQYGQRWLGNNYSAKVFNIPITVVANNANEYLKKVEAMSNALIQLGKTETSIVFGQFPDRTFYGHFTQLPEPAYTDQGSWDSTLTLQFTASDPHGYLQSETGQADNQNRLNFIPKGNDVAKPVYQFAFSADSNNFGYTNGNGENVFVGFPDDVNTQDLMPIVYTDPMEDVGTFTQVRDMSTHNCAFANGEPTSDGVLKP